MALTPLTDNNSVTTLDGQVIFFSGNTAVAAGKLRAKRLDGTGDTFLSTAALTAGNENYLLLYMGDSHIAGGVANPPQAQFSAMLTNAAGVFAAYSAANHVFAVNGIKVVDLPANQLPGMLAYIAANKANYTRVVAVVGGGTNDTTYGVPVQGPGIYGAKRYLCQQLAKAGAKVVVLTMPPNTDRRIDRPAYGTAAWPEQYANTEGLRKTIDGDSVANFLTEYGAAAVTASHRQDPQLYTETAELDFPQYHAGDGIHYNAAGQNLWGRRHIVPAILRAIAYMPPARLAPTALAVDTTAKTLSFTKATADALGLHEYSLDTGATWAAVTSLPIALANGTYASGAIKVRVAAYGTQVAGPALSSTIAYTLAAPAPQPGWEDAAFSDLTNATATGNSWRSTQDDNYQYITAVNTTKQFSGNGGIRTTVNTSLRAESFTGLRSGGPSTGGASSVPFGIRISSGDWSPTSNGANNGAYSLANGDVLSLMREGNALVWYQNGVEKSRDNNAGSAIGNIIYGVGLTAYNNAGADNVQMKADGGLVAR